MSVGRAKRLVNAYAEDWPIENLNDLPDMWGIYILYDRHHIPLKVGEAGRGEQTIAQRIRGLASAATNPYYAPKIRFFSAYDVDSGYQHQLETLILRSLKIILRWNSNKGRFMTGSVRYDPP